VGVGRQIDVLPDKSTILSVNAGLSRAFIGLPSDTLLQSVNFHLFDSTVNTMLGLKISLVHHNI
jgi:hypothetical protein